MKHISDFIKKHQRYDNHGHSRISILTLFYFKQLLKSTILLYIGYIPMNLVHSYYTTLASLNQISAKTAFIAQMSTIMYGFISAILMGLAIYAIIFKIKWNYVEYYELKATRKLKMKSHFTLENRIHKKGFKEVVQQSKESMERPMDKLNDDLKQRQHNLEKKKKRLLKRRK